MSNRTDGRLTKKTLLWGVITIGTMGAIALTYSLVVGNVKTGFGADQTVMTSEKRDRQGNIIETAIITTIQDAKTLWDWLSLLGVPFSLAVLGFVLQQLQQSRAEQQAKAEKVSAEQQVRIEKEIAESNQREEALQNYLDRLSELLIDKNLIATAVRFQAASETHAEGTLPPSTILEEKELLDAASDVIRARTLSLLRRLEQDGERKGDVIRFLIEAKVINKLKLSLSGVDLKDADLKDADLTAVDLRDADLRGANLMGAKLINADLINANLCEANLKFANLMGAKLINTNLMSANLINTNLRDAELRFANLSGAKLDFAKLMNANLSNTKLSDANLIGADLSDARNWTDDQLVVTRLFETKLPEGCNLNPNRDPEAYGYKNTTPAD